MSGLGKSKISPQKGTGKIRKQLHGVQLLFFVGKRGLSLPPFHIQFDEDEKEHCKAPQGRASIAEQRKGDAYYRNKPHCHSNIYEYVHKEAAGNTIAVDAGKVVLLPFAEYYKPYYKEKIYSNYCN